MPDIDPRILIAGAFFVAFWVTGLVVAGLDASRRRQEERLAPVREALGARTAPDAQTRAEAAAARPSGEGMRPWTRLLVRLGAGLGSSRAAAGGGSVRGGDAAQAPGRPVSGVKKIARRLRRAGLPWRVEEFLSLQAVAAAVGGGLLVLVGHAWAWGLPGLALGWFAPNLYVNARQNRRIARAVADLPAALSMMSGALKSGHSFLQAVETVARELEGPLAEEFEQLVHEVRLNVSMEDALANLVDRVRSDDLDLVVTAVLIQRQVGGNLAQVLDQIASTIRERVRILGEVRVLTSQGRLSGWIVGALPVALLILISLMNPAYMRPLLDTGLGRAMLAGAAFMELIGALVIRGMVRIEV